MTSNPLFQNLPRTMRIHPGVHAQTSVHEVVSSLLAKFETVMAEKNLTVELELDAAGQVACVSPSLCRTLDRLLLLAIQRCPRSGEVLITAVESDRGLEIEIADSGPDTPKTLESNQLLAFRHAPLDESALFPSTIETGRAQDGGHQIFCSRCPQGGLAWTVLQRRAAVALKVA